MSVCSLDPWVIGFNVDLQVRMVRRFDGSKEDVPLAILDKKMALEMELIQHQMFENAKKERAVGKNTAHGFIAILVFRKYKFDSTRGAGTAYTQNHLRILNSVLFVCSPCAGTHKDCDEVGGLCACAQRWVHVLDALLQ